MSISHGSRAGVVRPAAPEREVGGAEPAVGQQKVVRVGIPSAHGKRDQTHLGTAMCCRGTIGRCPDNQGEYTDMFTAGIVDPARVTRSALQNAASIAGMR